jgi:hypothetical protein
MWIKRQERDSNHQSPSSADATNDGAVPPILNMPSLHFA